MNLSDNQIKDILVRSKIMLYTVAKKKILLKRHVDHRANDIISSHYLNVDMSGMPRSQNISDVSVMIIKLDEMIEHYKGIFELLNYEQAAIEIVLSAFDKIPEQERDILYRLYILNQPYKTIYMETGLRNKAISKIRKDAFKLMQKIIQSEDIKTYKLSHDWTEWR